MGVVPVDVPQFELVGPPCEVPGCKGVLVTTLRREAEMVHFLKCSECGAEVNHMRAQDRLDWLLREIDRIRGGEEAP